MIRLLVTRGARPRKSDIAFLVADALAPIFGGLLALVLLPTAGALTVFLALAAGLFLYTAISDLLPEAHRRSHGLGTAVATIGGVAFIGVAVRLLWS